MNCFFCFVLFCCKTETFAIAASKSIIFVWQHTHSEVLTSVAGNELSTHSFIQKTFHVDELMNKNKTEQTKFEITDTTNDGIVSICGIKEHLIVARNSGNIVWFV